MMGRGWLNNNDWVTSSPGTPSALKITITKKEDGGSTKWKEEIVAMYEGGETGKVFTEEHEVSK